MFGFRERKMSDYRYKFVSPKDSLYADCYVHQVMNFRYHWHPDEFELNILLHGRQHFFQGTDVYDLEENDVILINPNVGHASYCDPEGTIAFVLHFSSSALKQFTKKNSMLAITDCLSSEETRNNPAYKRVRMHAAEMMYYLNQDSPFASYLAKASLEMLIGTLCTMFESSTVLSHNETDEETQAVMRSVLDYMEEHYSEKITLEQIARLTGYNRTYISTLFHQTVGIRFYDYLIRIRLQKAINELITTDKSLTEIALYNGFSDLKSFNARFRDMLKILPSQYRSIIQSGTLSPDYFAIRSIPWNDPLIEKKLQEYMSL